MSAPYSTDAQIFTFGVPGGNDTSDQVGELTRRMSAAVGATTRAANLWDTGFDWRARGDRAFSPPDADAGTAPRSDTEDDRRTASARLAAHVLQQVDTAIERGRLDPGKPLTIHLVGVAEGGNVSILGADRISEGLRDRRIDAAIHVTTLCTPPELAAGGHPDRARDRVEQDGVRFAHTHFNTPGDGVVRWVAGQALYDSEVTRNYSFPNAPFGLDGMANHRAVQHVPEMMGAAAEVMRQRFAALAPGQQRGDEAGEVRVPGITLASRDFPAVDWPAFSARPLVQEASDALHRAVPNVPQQHLNPSVVAGVAGVAAENRFEHVGSVAFSRNLQTAFVIDRDATDAAARVTPMDMALAHKPTEDVVQRYRSALDGREQQTAEPGPTRDPAQPQQEPQQDTPQTRRPSSIG